MSPKGLTVGQVAQLSKVSVRTLHHYDEIGLFRAGARTDSGYRLYGPDDLERLQQILFFRELGFPLEEIRRIVSDPTFDVAAALTLQRQLLVDKIAHLHRILGAVDLAIGRHTEGAPESTEGSPDRAPEATPDRIDRPDRADPPKEQAMSKKAATPEEMFEVFGVDTQAHEPEVKQRWGHTEAYKESARRTAEYTKEQWAQIKAEGDQLSADLAALMERAIPATAPEVLPSTPVDGHQVTLGDGHRNGDRTTAAA